LLNCRSSIKTNDESFEEVKPEVMSATCRLLTANFAQIKRKLNSNVSSSSVQANNLTRMVSSSNLTRIESNAPDHRRNSSGFYLNSNLVDSVYDEATNTRVTYKFMSPRFSDAHLHLRMLQNKTNYNKYQLKLKDCKIETAV
jgi:hypothetical protein